MSALRHTELESRNDTPDMAAQSTGPIHVAGMARAGTSWVGEMFRAAPGQPPASSITHTPDDASTRCGILMLVPRIRRSWSTTAAHDPFLPPRCRNPLRPGYGGTFHRGAHRRAEEEQMRALGLVLILPFMLALLAVIARVAQRNLEIDLRDDQSTQLADSQTR
jgi:hypothetical protein